MDIGIFHQPQTVDEAVTLAQEVAAGGFSTFCMPQIFGIDALTTLAVVAREVPGLGLATGVVPTYPRHPMMLAAQALTVQQVSGGRLTLGIGLSHQIVIESMLGISFEKPVRHLREYLSILMPLLHGEPVDAEGETLTGQARPRRPRRAGRAGAGRRARLPDAGRRRAVWPMARSPG